MATKRPPVKPTDPLPFRDPVLSLDARVTDLLDRMTPAEKVGQMCQWPVFGDLREAVVAKGLGSILCGVDEDADELQRLACEQTRLGIPLLVAIDAIHGHSMQHNATIFPSALALACAWDEALCQRVARATAREMAYTCCAWTFSPVLCLPRDLRWGRVDETFGEDPYLIGLFGAAMVRGYQGDDLAHPESVAACAKHYAGYGDTQGGREASESDHSERKMRSLFLPPFAEAAKAGCATYMTAYQVIDGTPCTCNPWLLRTVLRHEWRSDALVVTDWANVSRMIREQFVAADFDEATTRAVHAGNDMIMTTPEFYEAALRGLESGAIPAALVDEAVARILRLKFRLGLFENPRRMDKAKAKAVIGCNAHRALALQAAEESAVLLKNTGILPLRRDITRTIAVIGPNADNDLEQLGDWSLGAGQGQGRMRKHDRAITKTLLDGLIAQFGADAEVRYAAGCGVREPGLHKIAQAVRLAEASDVVVLALGDQLHCTGECKSTATLELQGGQKALVEALAATGTPLVVVFIASKPLAIPEVDAKADAVLCAFNPGMEGGVALAKIIAGSVAPQGRLTLSFPCHVGQQPVFYNQTAGAHHQDYPDLPGKGFFGLYPFGFGLTYTTFGYYGTEVSQASYAPGETVRLSVEVRNTGDRDGVETVQVYMRDVVSSVTWPRKNLVAFRKVALKSGESRRITFEIPGERFAILNARCERVVEPGAFELLVGGSSKDSDLKTVRFMIGAHT
ncbi:MAG: beta-glucosidase [Lentisphaerae bacterium]|nr:beta-glucosidase [Lentisphaerota bacterium]